MVTQPPRAPYRKPGKFAGKFNGPKPEPKILFQQFFKSVGPRTYAAQVKQAANGNHFLVLTEGKRDDKTNEASQEPAVHLQRRFRCLLPVDERVPR